ncbi:hypothetical protein PMIN06_011312 [Paraphaeosphaeria minitans]|uniref:Uncharacterized protein n=1 Tax=Paraphaeosphaeria minitans TaxID=565426 RepID=A0A9P6G4N1_9PLEO|nr:hypothetical protein PMIN01_13456 [Paraphaeosphaeria minitans]
MSPSTLQPSPPIGIPNRQRPSSIADDYGTGPQKSKLIPITPRNGYYRRCGSGNASAPGLYQDTGAGLEDKELWSLDHEFAPLEEAPLPPKPRHPQVIFEKQQIDKAREEHKIAALRRKQVAKTPKLRSIEEIAGENTAGDCQK